MRLDFDMKKEQWRSLCSNKTLPSKLQNCPHFYTSKIQINMSIANSNKTRSKFWSHSKNTTKTRHHSNTFSANFPKWSNTLKQFVGNLTTNCFSVFDHFVGLALKGLMFPLLLWPCTLWSKVAILFFSRSPGFCEMS